MSLVVLVHELVIFKMSQKLPLHCLYVDTLQDALNNVFSVL
jgi:hypothetical protein